MQAPYFYQFEDRMPPEMLCLSRCRALIWQMLAGLTTGLGIWYLHWRWTSSINIDALWFSIPVVVAETLCFAGSLLFFHDIWDEGDCKTESEPIDRRDLGLSETGQIIVDLFITTYDEPVDLLRPTLDAARQIVIPACVTMKIDLLDDGDRPEMRRLALDYDVTYHCRFDNRGYKAGNLRNALFSTHSDFVVICDADTRVLPQFLVNTLGYFRDPAVAWVQTPHWFYDLPPGQKWQGWLGARIGSSARFIAPFVEWLCGRSHVGADPYQSDPLMFFDVIQRRRNRNFASFCCGAGSIHRREAIFDNALRRQVEHVWNLAKNHPDKFRKPLLKRLIARCEMEPFRFHVSDVARQK